jgi:hypothetical protein
VSISLAVALLQVWFSLLVLWLGEDNPYKDIVKVSIKNKFMCKRKE